MTSTSPPQLQSRQLSLDPVLLPLPRESGVVVADLLPFYRQVTLC
jgi:hypothetical protein